MKQHASLFYRRIPVTVALIGFLLAVALPVGATTPGSELDRLPMLLGAPDSAKATVATKAAPRDPSIARQRAVAVNPDVLTASATPARIGIELFDGQVVAVNVELFEQRSPTNYTLHGAIPGSDKSQVVLTVVDGKIAGTLTLVDEGAGISRTYLLVPTADADYSLQEINAAGLPEDHPSEPLVAPIMQQKGNTKAAAAGTADSGGTVDVMVVYSKQTATAAGAAINAQIQQVIDSANIVYANSGIAMRLHLVHTEAVPYDETGNMTTDLTNLTSGLGGLASVPALRNTHSADIVSLFIEGMQNCGLSWIGPSAGYAFSVVNRGCALSNQSFVHEVGHNFGALHEPAADPSVVPYAFGHGFSHPPGRWRDVMSVGTDCVAVGGCSRINFFSNPNLTYGLPPAPLGNNSASDVARVHNQNAYTVANFRSRGEGGCSFAVPSGIDVVAAGFTGSFAVTGTPGCPWGAVSEAPAWLQIVSATGSGSGALTYKVLPNTGIARGANIAVGGKDFGVYQLDGCVYKLGSASATAASTGLTAKVVLSAGAGCPWTAMTSADWLFVSPAAGFGAGTLSYTVTPNTGAQRSASLVVGGRTIVVTQAAAPVAAPAKVALSAASIKFAAAKVDTTSASKSVTLRNSGSAALTVTAMAAGGNNPGDFLRSGTCAVGTTLAAGKTCTITYTFKPAAANARWANLTVVTTGGTVGLALSGQGTVR